MAHPSLPEPPKLYRVAEIAEILKVSVSTVYSILGVSLDYLPLPRYSRLRGTTERVPERNEARTQSSNGKN